MLAALLGGTEPTAAAPSAASERGLASPASSLARSAEPLPELPPAPSLELPPPRPDDVALVDDLLTRLSGRDAMAREQARRELLETTPRLVAALQRRIVQHAETADRDALRSCLDRSRDAARDARRKQMRAAGEHGEVVTPDYLDLLLDRPAPDEAAWRTLVQLAGISRMLSAVGTVDAVRQLILLRVRFGELLRVDTQLQLAALGERALAALIETRHHRAEEIGKWAQRQLDLLGNAIPSEAVQTTDPQVLADVVRAYGRIKDPEAARVIVSFANSERAEVRRAARQAVAMLGEVGNWQVRDTFESVVGQKPPREWSWDRTARELFARFDHARLAQVQASFEAGLEAAGKARFDEMARRFDEVLAQSPLFEQRARMVPGLIAYADQVEPSSLDTALTLLRRAERLESDPVHARTLHARILVLRARQLLARGIADPILLERALEIDPGNAPARRLLESSRQPTLARAQGRARYLLAALIGTVSLGALLLVVFLRRDPKTRAAAPTPHSVPPDGPPGAPPAP